MNRFTIFKTPLATLLSGLLFTGTLHLTAAPVKLVEQSPVEISRISPEVILVDFGRVAFGNLKLTAPADSKSKVTIHFGEALKGGRIDRKPPGTVRYNLTKVDLSSPAPIIAAPPVDKRNTGTNDARHPPAILTPPEWGVVLPFRWVEVEGWPGELKPEQIVRQAAFSSTWDDDAADFECSDPTLNAIWDLCRYSIKATTFAGVYVDGDRERIPYEADSYLNQLSHYATDNDVQMARDTYDSLMAHPTWPTEWGPHMVFMAHADWMHTGDSDWLAPRYEALKKKCLLDRVGPDGLIVSSKQQIKRDDIVDWPRAERNNFVFTEINTVVNAFHLKAIEQMAELARAVGKDDDATDFTRRFQATRAVFQKRLFDPERGVYRDGVGTEHASQHASLFPLAFGLVPEDKRKGVVDSLRKQGMLCSVYAAQYLLEGLFEFGGGDKALALITADNDRSWKHMVESGTTISWEAWDLKYKPNQDWNHAWGAAPANILPRFVLGAETLTPGWETVRIRPNPGSLSHAKGKIPTPRGPLLIDWKNGNTFQLSLTLPEGVLAKLDVPAAANTSGVQVNGTPVKAERRNKRWILAEEIRGTATVEVK